MPAKRNRPSPKIKKAFKAIIENESAAKPKPVGQVLQEAGYSKATAKTPSTVINSGGFQYLMEKAGITDEQLNTTLKEGLHATKVVGKEGDIETADYAVRHKYLETALKLKGIQEVASSGATNVYNTQINQTNIDPNSTEAKKIVDNTLDILMNQTLAD